MKGLIAVCLLLGALALGGLHEPRRARAPGRSAPSTASPQNAGEPPAPAPASPAPQAPAGVQPTPRKALAAFAELYVNWSYRTLTRRPADARRDVGRRGALAEQQAAASSEADTTIARGHICNSGQIVSIARDLARPGTWVIVTREQTGGDTSTKGCRPPTTSRSRSSPRVPGGYAVSEWLPQS